VVTEPPGFPVRPTMNCSIVFFECEVKSLTTVFSINFLIFALATSMSTEFERLKEMSCQTEVIPPLNRYWDAQLTEAVARLKVQLPSLPEVIHDRCPH
jgi:hypothetical protein